MLIKPRRPSGFGEYLPGEQIQFNRLLGIISQVYEKYGYTPLDTPDVELTEVMLAGGGGETTKQVYRFTREDSDKDLTLRYDLTVPLARYVAEHEAQLAFPFRRSQIGKVHRAERAQAGRMKEFYQCDIDAIGSNSPIIDAEFPAVVNEIFEKFGFGEFTIRINNRMILNGFFEEIGLETVAIDVLRIIDKIEKISREELVENLRKVGLDDTQVERLLDFTSITGDNDQIIRQLEELNITSSQFNEGVTKLKALVEALRVMEVPESRFRVDLKIARGLDYYTGTVYETFFDDYPGLGSVCSGGRYDNLAGHYTTTNLPGVGISIGLSRLFYKLREVGAINATRQNPADVIVMPFDDEQFSAGIITATKLRDAGIPTILHTEIGKLGKKLAYANRMGLRYVVLIGGDEMASDTVSLKDMESGETTLMTVDKLIKELTTSN